MVRAARAWWIGLAAIAAASPVDGQEAVDRLSGFEPFLGRWRPTPEFLEDRPQLAGIDAEVYQRGPRGSMIRVFEFVDPGDPANPVFEGFIYWHPGADELRFSGYNARDLYYFEGRYVVEPGKLTREMTVYYPDGTEFTFHPERSAPVRRFRSVRTLTAPDTMTIVVDMDMDGEWRPWPSEDVPPRVLVRVSGR